MTARLTVAVCAARSRVAAARRHIGQQRWLRTYHLIQRTPDAILLSDGAVYAACFNRADQLAVDDDGKRALFTVNLSSP